MDLNTLEERLEQYGSGGYLFLEAFIIKLLQVEGEQLGQKIEGQDSHGSTFDAIAPSGIGEISSPLLVEIVFSVSRSKLDATVEKFRGYGTRGYSLLIIAPKISDLKKSIYISEENPRADSLVYLWGEKEVNELMLKHQAAVEMLTTNLFSLRLKMAAERTVRSWKEDRDQLVKVVAEKYRAGRFSLILGAGVSSSAGLPDWNTLLNSLFVSMLSQENFGGPQGDPVKVSAIVARLMEVDGPSTLMLARYIRKGLAVGSPVEQQGFVDAITHQLYSLRDKRFSVESDLISSIAKLCTPTRTGANVKSILTYNFDDFIERALLSRSLIHKSVFEEFETPTAEELPIYHVHGFLPEDRQRYSNLDRCTLVFSEEGYHQIYRDAYHWSNLVQLNSFKESSCLMIGLSLTDPNLRRLLEIASKSIEEPKHFAFMRRLTPKKFMEGTSGKPLKISNTMVERFLERHHATNEELMRELGVSVIWYEEYGDIPEILNKIRAG
ncbi:SIR2-like domain-containing protein [Pseudomonas sp. NFACC23-1]|uniref:SIR2 family protein n=1 Tax=unclassified Pseudomonas TaxID=196821 RepID=UPI00087E9543|nr:MULTISPECIES: SIR2 family protein [unclassified Pseudomonas]SDB53773.1 SIR2-like domain-containing protein [Pseudomonas sp. NFACC17-2]SEJ74470.1 SIR2-like domain-containing protein [Pseudomonas sp. NFACC23-1]SFW86214.1 SIR2-like domain-containing protein [Pseudomonas sp. NFACC16-2]